MFDIEQFRSEIVQKALDKLKLYSKESEQLLMLTCAVASLGGTYLKESRGFGLGVFGMSAKVHDELWLTYLPKRSDLAYHLLIAIYLSSKPPAEFLKYNLLYAAMMCRLKYFFVKEPMPKLNDINSMALYWHTYYNTDISLTVGDAVAAYNRFMGIKEMKKVSKVK